MRLRRGFLGAGSWALASHLPNLARRRDEVKFVASALSGQPERCRPAPETGEPSGASSTPGVTLAAE